MEHISTWVGLVVALLTVVILPLVNTLITNRIDKLENKHERDIENLDKKTNSIIEDFERKQKEDRDLYFSRLDDLKDVLKNEYVRRELYEQALHSYQKETDSKFINIVQSMNKEFQNIKDLINEKFNGNKNGIK